MGSAGAKVWVRVRHNEGVALEIERVSANGARLVGELTVAIGERVYLLFDVDGRLGELSGRVIGNQLIDISKARVTVQFTDLNVAATHMVQRLVAPAG